MQCLFLTQILIERRREEDKTSEKNQRKSLGFSQSESKVKLFIKARCNAMHRESVNDQAIKSAGWMPWH